MEGIDNPINAIGDLPALLLQLDELSSGQFQLGFQAVTFTGDGGMGVVGSGRQRR